jgi:hypothetical protein
MATKKMDRPGGGVLFGFQAPLLYLRAPPPPRGGGAPIGIVGVIYLSPLDGLNTQGNVTTISSFLIENCVERHFFEINILQDIILIHFVRHRCRLTNIFHSGHFELYLFKVSGVFYAPAIPFRVKSACFYQRS